MRRHTLPYIVFAIVTYLLLSPSCVQAVTNISGLITADTTWTLANSPYIVTGNILVNEGVTLTIDPGVEVRFDTDRILQVNGELIAKGTSEDMIIFTSNATIRSPGDWGHIYLSDSIVAATYDENEDYLDGSILKYCVVEYGGGVEIFHNGAIILDNAHPFIESCIIRNSTASGIDAYNLTSLLKIIDCTITNNIKSTYGGGAGGKNGGGIAIEGGTFSICYNEISYNQTFDDGGGIALSGQSTGIVSNNHIFGNIADDGGGIQSNSSVVIENNIIRNNTSRDGAGIRVNSGTYTISNNIIMANDASSKGGGFFCEGGQCEFSKNIVLENEAGSVGGGICVEFGDVIIQENIIIKNTSSFSGGGMYFSVWLHEYFSTPYPDTANVIGNVISNNISNGYGAFYFYSEKNESSFSYNFFRDNESTDGTISSIQIKSFPAFHHNVFSESLLPIILKNDNAVDTEQFVA